MIRFRSIITKSLLAFSLLSVMSCSNSDYENALPANATALMSMDIGKMAGTNNEFLLKALLKTSNIGDCGIDLTRRLYLFETQNGSFGLCASVTDEAKLRDKIGKLAAKGVCSSVSVRRGFAFSTINGKWLAGWSDNSLLVMGPVLPADESKMQNTLCRYLSQEEEESGKASALFERLDTINSKMGLVARADAMPEKVSSALMLGAPKNADASQVLLAADMDILKGRLEINGKTFSLNKNINAALDSARASLRPIEGKYVKTLNKNDLLGVFMNVEGTKLLPMLRNNRALQVLLFGLNTAVDMDNIIMSIDGDLAMTVPRLSDTGMKLSMAAQLDNADWLKDVDYWKKSCPQGSSIIDWNKNSYCYSDKSMNFFFGVTDDLQFFSGSSKEEAMASLKGDNAENTDLSNQIIGKKMVTILNLPALGDSFGVLSELLKPLFGKFNKVVYTID